MNEQVGTIILPMMNRGGRNFSFGIKNGQVQLIQQQRQGCYTKARAAKQGSGERRFTLSRADSISRSKVPAHDRRPARGGCPA
jgi:hypothetical protein